MNTWPHNLSEPVCPLDNTRIAVIQSALTRDGQRATWSEARAYAAQQSPPEPITNYDDRRGY